MLAIKNNLMSQGASRSLNISYNQLSTSVQRLSSGLRINSAKDDAAGLAVRELIRADVAALEQGSRNAMDGVSMLQAAEGALGEIDSILVRMRELSEQAATDTYSDTQKGIMQNEFDELAAEITRIADTTNFNDINLLEADASGQVSIGLGNGVSDTDLSINIDKSDMTAENLGLIGKAEKTVADKGNAVALTSASETYLNNSDTANAATLTLTFGGTAYSLSFTADESKSLNDVVNAINTAAGETVATAVDNGSGSFVLQLKNTARGDVTDMTITNSGTDVAWGTGSTAVATAGSDFTTTNGTSNLDLTAGDDAAITAVESAITTKDTYRAKLGYWMNRLEYASSVLDVQAENLLAAESRISDVDVATEMSRMTRNQVLAQAGISMLAQANSMPQMALQLLG